MVPVSTTSEFLLADARAALRRRASEDDRTELSRAFGAWLRRDTNPDSEFASLVREAATREGARQDFHAVAILGFGADAGDDGSTDHDCRHTLNLAMRELPDELPHDRAALRLAAVESVIHSTAPTVDDKELRRSLRRRRSMDGASTTISKRGMFPNSKTS